MRIGKSTRLGRSWIVMAGALGLPREALAGWGDDWGAMVWGAGASAVPSLGWLGLAILAMGLAATAAWTLRKRRPALGLSLSLVLLVIPLAVAAGTVTVPNTFTNGTVADADEVNANFGAVKTAVDDNDGRITTLEGLQPLVSCVVRTAGPTPALVMVACQSGETLTGGGCDQDFRANVGLRASRPRTDATPGWFCAEDTAVNQPITAYAICCS